MNDHDPVLEIEGLTKRYGELTALSNLTLTLNRGRILGLIGPNGAGKTTAIKILVGLTRPTSGSAKIANVDCVHGARRIKRLVGYMPDLFGSYDNMRVHEYLDFFGSAFGIPRRRRVERIAEVLETTSAAYMRDRYVETLSHGMKQRIGIARTLLHDPQVLILDEPANGLDPHARIEMRHLLLRLAEMGKTLLVTSHILPELSRICHQVAILIHGELKAFGALDEIMRQVSPLRTMEVVLNESLQLENAVAALAELIEDESAIHPAPEESILRFDTDKTDEQLGEVLSHLIGAGVGVTQFRELPTDLEEAFLRVAKQNQLVPQS